MPASKSKLDRCFSKIMDLWFQELMLDQQFQIEITFRTLNRAQFAKDTLNRFYYERNRLDESDAGYEYFQNQINYFVKNNKIPKRNYYPTPEHFAKMVCVGFELCPNNDQKQSYLAFYRNNLECTDKFLRLFKKTLGHKTYYTDFLSQIFWKDRSFLNELEDLKIWKKHIIDKYERILLSQAVRTDVKSKKKYPEELAKIKSEIKIIKDKIEQKLHDEAL